MTSDQDLCMKKHARSFATQLYWVEKVDLDQMIIIHIFLKCHRFKKNTKTCLENVIKKASFENMHMLNQNLFIKEMR